MAHMTNGTIYYERRVKTGDWEHKHAHLTVNFSLDPGDDADELLARARTLVVQHVHQAVGIKVAEPTGPLRVASNGASGDPVSSDLGGLPAPGVAVVVPDELNRGFIIPESFTKPDEDLLPRTTLKEAMAEIIPPVTNLRSAKRRYTKKVTSPEEMSILPDPTPVVSSGPSSELVVETSPASSETVIGDVVETPVVSAAQVISQVDDILFGQDDFTAEAPAATDMELSQALSRVNAKLKDRPRIQALIGEFVQHGQSYSMIPAVRRTEFLTKLEALV